MTDHDATFPPSPFPIEETRRALEVQTTPEVITKARQYARARVRVLRLAGRPVSRTTARELVNDAYADTWIGIARWNPAQCPLLGHLRRRILQQTWVQARRARKISFVPMHYPANDNVSPKVERALAAAAWYEMEPGALYSLVTSVCEHLRPLVTDDDEAEIVACWTAGLVERDEIVTATGLDQAAYDRARKRLMYRTRNLSPDLRALARKLFRNAS